MKLDLFL